MSKQASEHTVLLVSILKWAILATIIGCIVGLTTTAFLKLLDFSINFQKSNPIYLLTIPLFLFINALILYYVWPKDNTDTTDKVIRSIHESKPISWKSGLKAFFLPILTIAGGGSAGKEAPCADVGAASGSLFAKILRFNINDTRKLMICGVSAGFAAVFGTPIAGAIFGVEMLFVGGLLYDVLLPSFIAGITAFYVSSSLGIQYFSYNLNFAPIISGAFLFKVVLAGIFCGIISYIIIEVFKKSRKYSEMLQVWPPLKALFAGALIVIIALIFSTQYLGLGIGTMESVLVGTQIVWYAFLIKLLVTALTLNFGGSGGVITPVLFIGTVAGALFASLLGLNTSTFAAIGLVAVLAGVTNTPIAASIMAIELFGPQIGMYAALACVIAFLMSGYRSLLPSQILSINKSESLRVQKGSNMSDAKVTFKTKRSGAMKYIIQTAKHTKKIQKKLSQKRHKYRRQLIKAKFK